MLNFRKHVHFKVKLATCEFSLGFCESIFENMKNILSDVRYKKMPLAHIRIVFANWEAFHGLREEYRRHQYKAKTQQKTQDIIRAKRQEDEQTS